MKGIVIAVALAGLVGAASDAAREPRGGEGARPAWTEIAWPFLFDAWGPGRAFRCPATACNVEVSVYARTKAGFCNCYRGVEDDDEIDRIGDVDLHGERYLALAPGRAAAIGDRVGRRRDFRTDGFMLTSRRVRSIVVATNCNALVATVVTSGELSPAAEVAVTALLNGEPVQSWVAANYQTQ